jgi:hypothetical protein
MCLEVTTSGKTGVEMEALTGQCSASSEVVLKWALFTWSGATVAALTVYDMCKVGHCPHDRRTGASPVRTGLGQSRDGHFGYMRAQQNWSRLYRVCIGVMWFLTCRQVGNLTSHALEQTSQPHHRTTPRGFCHRRNLRLQEALLCFNTRPSTRISAHDPPAR